MAQPFLVPGHRSFVIGEIHNARSPETDIGTDTPVHRFPEALGFECHGDLAGVAAHHPHPAPVPAGLLVPDIALLADRDRYAALRQFQRRRDTDDSPANDRDIHRLRQ